MVVAIIPARGASKRIVDKNIRDFLGRPIIAYAIETAKKSAIFDEIFVSTDSQKIAEIAIHYGAKVPFMRPANLSDDFTGTTAVISHAVKALSDQGYLIDTVCCLYATSPLLDHDDLAKAYNLYKNSDCDYLFGIKEFEYPIQRALKLDQNLVKMFDEKYLNSRSQDLTPAFHDAGQFYFGSYSAWAEKKPVFLSNSYGCKLPKHRVYDIDTLEDWQMAEYLYKAINASGI